MPTTELNISRIVNTSVNLSPIAAAKRTFGTLLILGDSDVIDGSERIRSYTTIESVAFDFGTTAQEYLAAQLYFSQSPRPQNLSIGRWLRTATAGILRGGLLTSSEQALANFTSVTNGSFAITIDGTAKTCTAINLSTATNLNGVATAISTVLATATVTWTGSRFEVKSSATGTNSSVSFATAHTSGTDISSLLKLTSSLATNPISGFASESALAGVTALANVAGRWFGLMFATSVSPSDSDVSSVAAYIESASVDRIFGWGTSSSAVLDSTSTTDIASVLKSANYSRTFTQYSQNPNAEASFFGRAFSVDFTGNKTTITLMYKQEPGVVPESLTETQAQTLEAKKTNVFVSYSNDTAIIQPGVMCSGAFFDEIHGLSWFKDAVQNAVYNLLYQSSTKIPQTDAGQNQIVNAINAACDDAVSNGLIAPGIWNADGFGQLSRGDYLESGYYIYTPPIALQAQSDREARISPPIQIAAKLAGAFHKINISINVNR